MSWLIGCALVAAGCDSGPGYSGPPPVVEFDSATMQVRLPLDQYGMVPEEEALLGAARLVDYRNCMTAEGVDPSWLESDEFIADILTIGQEDLMPDWRFGFWNAGYVAEHGIEGPPPHDDAVLEPVSADHEAALEDPNSSFNQAWARCSDSGTVQFVWVGRGLISAKWAALTNGFQESYDKAKDDPRRKKVAEEWFECVESKGYPRPEEFFYPLVPDDAPPEMEAKALLDDTICSDEIGAAKRLAQIEAEYQMDYIGEHEAELVELQRRARELVAEAEKLVEDAGFSWPA
ncbi:MAG: hypothetical protein LBC97_03495 [Bifidobacteriaceae bacterium]|nr:hypothetical protein [Bifidobacteriaceae bacterium]